MCLIFLSLGHHKTYKLILAANRDEFYNRRTEAAGWWKDNPGVLGGRDLEAGGTWMAVSKSGKLALVTNYRDLKNIKQNAPSRGHLVSDFFETKLTSRQYMHEVQAKAQQYNGFNLLLGSFDEIYYASNYKLGIEKLAPGFYGLSNHLLNTPWPKLIRGKAKMESEFSKQAISHESILDALRDSTRAPDDQLPDTGVGLERERALSSMFIMMDGYGTRCSTVMTVDQNNHASFTERVYDVKTFEHTTHTFTFDIQGS